MLEARLRLVPGEVGSPPPRAAVARLLTDSGLRVLEGARAGQVLCAVSGNPAAGHVVLLVDLTDGGSVGWAVLVAGLAALAAIRATGAAPALGVTLICRLTTADGEADWEELPPVDACLWDGGGEAAGHPWLALGSHGLMRLRLRARGPGGPLGWGALVANPAWRLVWALAALKRPNEEVRIPGFYAATRAPEPDEAAALEQVAPLLAARPAARLPGLPPASVALVQAFSPAVTLTTFQIEPAEQAVPTTATAELALTLVPDQTPPAIVSALIEHLAAVGFSDVGVEVLSAYGGLMTPLDAPLVAAARRAVEDVRGLAPLLRPFGDRPAPLACLPARTALAAIGVGLAAEPAAEVAVRTLALARVLARLLASVASART